MTMTKRLLALALTLTLTLAFALALASALPFASGADAGAGAQAQATRDITGKVYVDTNGNGKQDAGEPGLAGAQAYAYPMGGGRYSAFTDPSGTYAFRRLPAGDYWVTIAAPNGYGATTGTALFTPPSAAAANFGAARYATIEGFLWADRNGNGTWDGGEPAAAGLGVQLSGPCERQTVTDGNGYYSFSVLPGTYTVTAMNGGDLPTTTADTVTVTVKSGQTLNMYRSYHVFGVMFSRP